MNLTKKNAIILNFYISVGYWAVSHLTWIIFNKIGVLPMPFWPAAAIEVLAAFFYGWTIAPALFIGSILANHFSLGGDFLYSTTIAITNVLGPIFGTYLLKKLITENLQIDNLKTLLLALVILLGIIPMIAATGGIGFKILLGLMDSSGFINGFLKWAIAHSMGILLFALPVFVYKFLKGKL